MSTNMVNESSQSLTPGTRSVTVRGEEFKFCCAHFVSYRGFRERLHGHNYTVEVDLGGPMSATDGYVIDFGILKQSLRQTCKSLNERIIVPTLSATLVITYADSPPGISDPESQFAPCGNSDVDSTAGESGQVEIRCMGSFFSFPKTDCALLPIRFSTAEELSTYVAGRLTADLAADIASRGIHTMTVRVYERPTQAASFTVSLGSHLVSV